MARQRQRPFTHRDRPWQHQMAGASVNFLGEMHEHAIVQQSETGGLHHFAVCENRRGENQIVALPFAGRTAGIHERRSLAIDGGALTIGRPLLGEGIEDLDFVEAVNNYTVVTAIVPGSFEVRGRLPFQMKLDAAK